jgi:hypothetical protein
MSIANTAQAEQWNSGDGPGMFAFADSDRLRQFLTEADWQDIQITPSTRRSWLAVAEAFS